MSLHNLLPLAACLLNVFLCGVALWRNAGSRLNRVFAYCVGGMAVWNFGVFMLRMAPDPQTAVLWEVVIHVGVVAIPVFYYHFVLIFLDSTRRRRRSLALAYGLAAVFTMLNLSGTPLFMKGVTMTVWGWAPTTGPLYLPFFIYVNAFLIAGVCSLLGVYRHLGSSFRRNRTRLIMLATVVTLSGGFIDFIRFIVMRFWPAAEHFYPVGIPANMLFALMLGTSIVRYRLFDVSAAVKRISMGVLACGIVTAVLLVLTRTLETYLGWDDVAVVSLVVPVGFSLALLANPLGDLMRRLWFSKRRGCYQTLVDLSGGMSTILNVDALLETLVRGLVRGIPLTHGVMLIYDKAAEAFVTRRSDATAEPSRETPSLSVDSPIVHWLQSQGGVLVREEVALNPRIARHLQTAEGELEALGASLIVPLKVETGLIGILLLGEKLSGEIFDAAELEVLSVLANQTAIALENARLYEELTTSNARLLQASRLKSQFLASMSHELRTPLNSIIGFSKVLLNGHDGALNGRQHEFVGSIHTSSTHLLALINSVLDIARIEAGKLEIRREEVDLQELIDECLESAAGLVRGKPVRIERDVPSDLPRVDADPTKLRQIILNLLSNAIKFTARGRVVVSARAGKSALQMTVADTGIGIPKADLRRLFEPFERLDNPLSHDVGGTGLGLAITKKFVELHGGRIWVESREHEGSVFHFTLPLVSQRMEPVSQRMEGTVAV